MFFSEGQDLAHGLLFAHDCPMSWYVMGNVMGHMCSIASGMVSDGSVLQLLIICEACIELQKIHVADKTNGRRIWLRNNTCQTGGRPTCPGSLYHSSSCRRSGWAFFLLISAMTSNTSESELLEQVLPSPSDSQSDSLLLSSANKECKKVFNHDNVIGLTTET